MSGASRSMRPADPSFESYVALAKGLVGNLTGICLLDAKLEPRGQHGELTGAAVLEWVRSLEWTDSHEAQPAAGLGKPHRCWSAMALQQTDGSLLGVFCVSQTLGKSPVPPARAAAEVAGRLKPLLDCVHRELSTAVPAHARLEVLTGRAAELEWLFNLTANLKGSVDEKRRRRVERRSRGRQLEAHLARIDATVVRVVDEAQCALREPDVESCGRLRGRCAAGEPHSGRHQRLDAVVVQLEPQVLRTAQQNEQLLSLRSHLRAMRPEARVSAVPVQALLRRKLLGVVLRPQGARVAWGEGGLDRCRNVLVGRRDGRLSADREDQYRMKHPPGRSHDGCAAQLVTGAPSREAGCRLRSLRYCQSHVSRWYRESATNEQAGKTTAPLVHVDAAPWP